MGSIGEAGRMGSFGCGSIPQQLAWSDLEPQPENVRSQRDTERFCENMGEPWFRETGDTREFYGGESACGRDFGSEETESSVDAGVNFRGTAGSEEFCVNPIFNLGCIEAAIGMWGPKKFAPATNDLIRECGNAGAPIRQQSSTQTTFGIDEADEDMFTLAFDLVNCAGADDGTATVSPAFGIAAANAEGPAFGEQKLNGIMCVTRGAASGAPHDHGGRP
jgi:hypothetical protein